MGWVRTGKGGLWSGEGEKEQGYGDEEQLWRPSLVVKHDSLCTGDPSLILTCRVDAARGV